jgi:enoyl-CoA hydratase/carnithine racemase
MGEQDITVEKRAGVAWLRFNRPQERNAVRQATMRELCAALDEVVADKDVRAVVLGAIGKHFCAGAEFSFLDTLAAMSTTDVQRDIYTYFQGAARRLYECPKPTIAAVQGTALTVGCELALMCDFRIVTPRATFQESWIRLGLLPPLGGMKLLPALIGLGKAKQMMLRGEVVDGAEAVAIGLANDIVEPEALENAAQTLAVELAGLPEHAYREVKRGLHRGLEAGLAQEWQSNVLAQSILLGTEDFRARLASIKQATAGRG